MRLHSNNVSDVPSKYLMAGWSWEQKRTVVCFSVFNKQLWGKVGGEEGEVAVICYLC